MINNIKIIYRISHLLYNSKTLPLLEAFQPKEKNSTFSLLNFHNQVKPPTLFSQLLASKRHAELLDLYLKFIEKAQ